MKQQITPERHAALEALRANLARVIRGKDEAIETLLIAFFSGGSVLLEDVPGTGKTTLAKALAKSVSASFNRIQFTPDLLPGDILGSSIYNPAHSEFRFRPGPIFCNILLADEINRASPRTQSALLEAMSEGQATIEGTRYPLESPFLVVATQNPVEFHGTYPLPEAQLDRFVLVVELGYPDADAEHDMLHAQAQVHPLDTLEPVLSKEQVVGMQTAVRALRFEESVSRYLIELVNATRQEARLKLGVSPRGSLMLFRAAQAAAFLEGRDYVLPDDVQRLAAPVLAHRLMLTPEAKYSGVSKRDVVREIVGSTRVPA